MFVCFFFFFSSSLSCTHTLSTLSLSLSTHTHTRILPHTHTHTHISLAVAAAFPSSLSSSLCCAFQSGSYCTELPSHILNWRRSVSPAAFSALSHLHPPPRRPSSSQARVFLFGRCAAAWRSGAPGEQSWRDSPFVCNVPSLDGLAGCATSFPARHFLAAVASLLPIVIQAPRRKRRQHALDHLTSTSPTHPCQRLTQSAVNVTLHDGSHVAAFFTPAGGYSVCAAA